MKIDKDKPLPSHTRLDYDECCAKLILEEVFPNRYHDLVLADQPDLQGIDVGIEVTTANDQEMQEALSNWIKACSTDDEIVKSRSIERMAQLGVKYTGGIQAWPGSVPTFSLTQRAIEAKIRRIKKGSYKAFCRYDLFVFTDTWYCNSVIEQAKQYLFYEMERGYYRTVFVLSQGADLHVFETERGDYENIRIDVSEQSDRNRRARQMVEEAEEQLIEI